jgi:glutamate 5-kinase
VAEIKFGDNDQLAAMVTGLLTDPLLIILSIVDGLFDGDPKSSGSKLIPLVDQWDDSLMGLAAPGRSLRGIGGMPSKLEAVRTATSVGESVIIANGTRANVLDDILAGKEIGTLFLAKGKDLPAWKRWIGFTVRPKGKFILDEGARRAVETQGKSLLAIGITTVEGEFAKGEVVSLVDRAGEEFARGLTNYNAHDARMIAGKRTEEIMQALGSLPYEEVIHRDNLVVTT